MKSVDMCKVSYIKDIDLKSIKPTRSGVIVYTVQDNKTYFILGIDTKTGDITDFGGGISLKKETILSGGLREFKEESLGIFGQISVDEIKNCLAIYDMDNVIIFIRLNIDMHNKYVEFMSRLRNVRNPEVKDLCFYDKRTFVNLLEGNVTGNIMYDRIRNLLYKAKKEHEFLRFL